LVGHLYAAGDRRWKDFLIQTIVMALIVALAFGGINNAAHAGGLVAGLPIGYVLGKERNPRRHQVVLRTLATLLLVASVASLAAAQISPLWRYVRQYEYERGG